MGTPATSFTSECSWAWLPHRYPAPTEVTHVQTPAKTTAPIFLVNFIVQSFLSRCHRLSRPLFERQNSHSRIGVRRLDVKRSPFRAQERAFRMRHQKDYCRPPGLANHLPQREPKSPRGGYLGLILILPFLDF